MATIVEFSADDAEYVGDEEDGVYVQVGEDIHGKWFVTCVVDCDSAGFVADLETDNGPHACEDDAMFTGMSIATDWCVFNGVEF